MKMDKTLMKYTSDNKHEEYARRVKRFEAVYGEDWEGTMVEYDNDFVSLPHYVYKAVQEQNIRTVLQWLGKGNIRERVNAKFEDGGNLGLLSLAHVNQQHDLMSYLLLKGADVNILNSSGMSVLTVVCCDDKKLTQKLLTHCYDDTRDPLKSVGLFLTWGAELYREGEQVTKEMKLDMCGDLSRFASVAMANFISPDLGGRRCEIISAPDARGDLVGKTCVVQEYIEKSNQYKVTMEFTNEELLLGADHLERRDRTQQDPGYYVEWKNNRLIRRDFESNDECQAFIASLGSEEDESAEVDPDAENKADQAAADLLAELGLGDLEGPSSDASKKGKQPVAAGKKKKRGGKKKGRK